MQTKGSRPSYCVKYCATSSVVLFAALAPILGHAQIIINEVMYDPPGSDTKQEWIELYNTGDTAVDLTKWTFSDGSSATKHGFNVPPKNGGVGSILIEPGAYAIIADDAVTFEAAFPNVTNVIDSTMTLPDPNAGASVTVTLYDPDKNTADTFVYVGGTNADNKGDSVQRSASGIIPAAPTPAMSNATAADTSVISTTSSGTQTDTQTQASQAPVSSYVPPPLPTLFADAGADATVIVGADTTFTGRAYLRTQDIVTNNVRYSWNFGDGTTAEGMSVTHHYTYPGRYAVVLDVAQNLEAASDRVIVTAEPAKLGFAISADGGIAIHNDAGRDLDLSNWIVRNFGQSFILPPESIILTGETLRIPQSTLHFWSSASTELAYPNGVLAFSAGTPLPAATPAAASAAAPQPTSAAPVSHTRAPTIIYSASPAPSDPPIDERMDVPEATSAPTTTVQAAAAGALPITSPYLWAAGMLALIAGTGSYLASRARKGEWEIEEG